MSGGFVTRFAVVCLSSFLVVAAGCGPTAKEPREVTRVPAGACLDNDGDGVPGTGDCAEQVVVDCNDAEPRIYPGAPERCDGLDNNCNGQIDDGLVFRDFYPDKDRDGFGDPQGTPRSSCADALDGLVPNKDDCDDADKLTKPGALEQCNNKDDNCDGKIDNDVVTQSYYPDADGDEYGAATATPQLSCAAIPGKVTNNQDCDDTDPNVKPGAVEVCNNKDDNCDGSRDEGLTFVAYYVDSDKDGYGAANSTAQMACAPVAGRVTNNDDCNDGNSAIRPGATELCNGIDDDCDGPADEGLVFLSYYPDADGDGFGAQGAQPIIACAAVPGRVANAGDCNDANPNVKPGASEVCNQIDDNCAGGIDEGLPTFNYYPDADGDGFGAKTASPVVACAAPTGMVGNNADCNDANPNVKPGAAELCNNIDDNCNDSTDEGNPGGGASCSTGQAGICAAGTMRCLGGGLSCVRNNEPRAELCNGLDDNCVGGVDETFPNKGGACSVGLGVCKRDATYVCAADFSGLVCNTTPGPTTAPACDGLDNDCDGFTDEPGILQHVDVAGAVWTDLELAPFYYSNPGCRGGVSGSGTDALAGAGVIMGGGAVGMEFARLDTNGAFQFSLGVTNASTYTDVAIAQAGEGFIAAGVQARAGTGPSRIDLFYVDGTTGAVRGQLLSAFTSSNDLDSLRLVRGNRARVTVLWREVGVGIRFSRVEPFNSPFGAGWSIQDPRGGSPVVGTLVAGAVPAGIGADSTHLDWEASQPCAIASALRAFTVAYLPTTATLSFFTVSEDGSGKGADVPLDAVTGGRFLGEPEVTFFRNAGADAWGIAFTTSNPAANPPNEDLNYWLTTDPSIIRFAFLSYATANGTDSIRRPRWSVGPDRLWLSSVRFEASTPAFPKQASVRRLTYLGAKDPAGSVSEGPATHATCGGNPDCREGNKDGVVTWAAMGKVLYTASAAGTHLGQLTCQ